MPTTAASAAVAAQDLGDLRRRDPQRRRDNADAAGGIQLANTGHIRADAAGEGHQPHLLRANKSAEMLQAAHGGFAETDCQ